MISELRQTRTKISRSRLIQWKQNLEWRLNSFATVADSSQLDRLSTPLNSIYSTNSTIISTILILLSESIKNSVQSLKITKISSYVKFVTEWVWIFRRAIVRAKCCPRICIIHHNKREVRIYILYFSYLFIYLAGNFELEFIRKKTYSNSYW